MGHLLCGSWVTASDPVPALLITQEGHLVVFIAVQNLVGIGAVVLITCVFRFREFGLKTLIHDPKIRVLGQNRRMGGSMLTPNELVLTFGGCYLCTTFGEK